MKSGQILILVLLIVVVSLAVGLSVASRNLTNLRISTQTQESQRAFSAAEGGVEDVLSRLNSIADHISTGSGSSGCVVTGLEADCDSVVGDISADIKVKARNTYETIVPLGEVAQVNVDGYQGTVIVEWPTSPHVSLELTLVCASPSNCLGGVVSGNYSQNRYAYQGPGAPLGDQTGSWQNCTVSGNTCSATIANILSTTNAKILRIKPFHSAVALKVSGSPSALPTQIYEINSVAKTDIGITRRVQVTRTALPALPAVFDYVLYSEGDIVK